MAEKPKVEINRFQDIDHLIKTVETVRGLHKGLDLLGLDAVKFIAEELKKTNEALVEIRKKAHSANDLNRGY